MDKAIRVVAKYYTTFVETDKIWIYYEFKTLDSKIKIFTATNAIALGYNIPDIKYAVQYRLTRGQNINTIYQRIRWCA